MKIHIDEFPKTVYEAVGGEAWFAQLVEYFYARVEADQLLRPIYPEDLSGPKKHTVAFLVQYWGGPARYTEERGHPRLRMRHARFVIGERERDAWLGHMLEAVAAMEPVPEVQAALTDYFSQAATHLINVEI